MVSGLHCWQQSFANNSSVVASTVVFTVISDNRMVDIYLIYGLMYVRQAAYAGMLQMFLMPRAVFLVVYDAGALGERDGGADEQLDKDICSLEKLRVFD